MFAGSMRGPRMKTPLLLLLLLLTTLTGTGICQEEYDGADPDTETHEEEAVVAEPDVDTDVSSEPSDYEATAAPEDPPPDVQNPEEDYAGSGNGNVTTEETEFGVNGTDPTGEGVDPQDLGLIIILIPVVLVVMIIGMIVFGIFINRRWNQKVRNQALRKEDPYLDGSSTEKVPMPMFEEDVPSVLELEMEDFDQWMKKDVEPAEDSIHA